MELVWSILAVLGAAAASVGVVWLLGRWLMKEESARLPVLVPVWGDAEELSLQLAGVYWRQPFWKREEPNFWLLDLGLTPAGPNSGGNCLSAARSSCLACWLPWAWKKGKPLEKAGRNRLLLFRTGVERKNRLPGLGKKAPDSPILVGETCRNVG